MSDFQNYVNTELPRRSAHLTKAITGYDGNPNDLAAPDIVKNSPLGTWFREETAGKWWRKTETIWAEETGGGGSSDPSTTTSSIDMAVDYILGTSPPASTLIANQSDYNTLVASFTNPYLKYPQDAVDILPAVIGHRVEVYLETGTHYAKPDSYYPGASYSLNLGEKVFDNTANGYYTSTFKTQPTIAFIGYMETLEAEQGGTVDVSAKTIVRDSGTWTVDEHKGKFVSITTGAGAGSLHLIESNTIDTLYILPYYGLSSGICTFEIVAPGAVWETGNSGFWLAASTIPTQILFENLQLGTAITPMVYNSFNGTTVKFTRCIAYDTGSSAYAPYCMEGAFVDYWDCNLVWTAKYGAWLASQVNMYRCLVTASHTQARDDIGAINCKRASLLKTIDTIIEPGSGFARVLVSSGGGSLNLNSGTIFRGNGLATALAVDSDVVSYAGGETILAGPQINNFAVAIHAQRGSKVRLFSVSGSGNDITWKLEEGALVTGDDPTTLGGTTEIDIDGETLTYADTIPNAGDGIEGKGGSRILR